MLHVRPTLSEPMVDEVGFSVELSAQQSLSPEDAGALAGPALVLARPTLARSPHEARGQVSIEDGQLWVALEVSGPGEFDAPVVDRATALFDHLWTAVWLGAREVADHLRSEAQLLALADASRTKDWEGAVAAATSTPPGPACPRG